MSKGTISPKSIKRSTLVGMIICAGFLVLLIRLLVIQIFQFNIYQDKVLSQITTETPIPAERGNIYDRNGNALATSIQTYRVFISPSGIKSAEEEDGKNYSELVATGLSEILDVKADGIIEQIEKFSNKLDRTIKKEVDKETAKVVREYIAEHSLETMIYLEAQDTRYYPGGDLASHIIGFTSGDGIGLYGLEYQYEEYLGGVDGYYVTARDSQGKEMPYGYSSIIEAIDGYNLHTTIDITIQSCLEEQLAATVEKYKAANRACGIVMDVETGAILAMATSSPFDLNDPWTLDTLSQALLDGSGYLSGSEEYSSYQLKLLTEMWSNKAVTESYIPGSTFKIITSSMAYEEVKANIPSSVTCNGHLKVSGQTIHCHETEGHGTITFAKGLQRSCNVWFMTLGKLIGTDTFNRYVSDFGYKEKTGIDLPGEANGIFTSQMTELDLAIYAFGQNFNVTPIQQITAISAVANGGNLVTPYLVEKITDDQGNVVFRHETQIKRQVVSEAVCKEISDILEKGVSEGEGAKNAGVKGYKIAAKTGTAEKKETGHSFVTLSEYRNLTLADAKKLIEEQGIKCTVVGTTADDAKIVGQVPAASTRIAQENGIVVLYTEAVGASMVQVPSLEGKTIDEAKRLLAAVGLNFTIDGTRIHSNIIDQSLTAGSYVEKGSVCKLVFDEGYVCSTVAYAPADNPEVAIIIIVDEPTQGLLYGSTVAAPYVSNVLKEILPYLGYIPSTDK